MTRDTSLGDAIRESRRRQGLTLDQLSARCGVSRAAISKIERGESGATTPVLGRIAEALDLSISQLIGGRESSDVVRVPRAAQPVFREEETGFERRSLSPLYFGRGVDFVRNTLPAGAKTGPFPSHREGVEEHLYVARGRLRVTLADESHDLEPGDFLFYRANLNHAFETLGDEPCEFFIVIDSTRLR